MKLKHGFKLHKFADRWVAIQADGGDNKMIVLNGTGKLLWELLETEQTEASLALALTQSFGVDTERAQSDVSAFVRSLKAMDMLI